MPIVLLAPMNDTELAALFSSAMALQHAATSGHGRILLRGKNIGLLSETPDDAAATLFIAAAQGLGAQVALIRPSHAGLLRPETAPATTRMLGRLYDAIECQGLPTGLVEQMRLQSGVAVLESHSALEACPPEWSDALQTKSPAELERLLVQAILVWAMTG